MESKPINLSCVQAKDIETPDIISRLELGDVFGERESYVNELKLFIAYFDVVPNVINIKKIDCKKAEIWFAEAYKGEIENRHFNRYINENRDADFEDILYILYDDLIVSFDTFHSKVKLLFRKTEMIKVENIINRIKKFKQRKKKAPGISLLVNTDDGITTVALKILKPKLLIEDNYNDDFKSIHGTIIKRLSQKNDKGLVLLHGKPGTGKTTYIRYLICTLKKNVIFLPPNMAGEITNPALLLVLIENPNSVLVIEDAEKIVVDRERDGNSAVSALLNIADGLLSDCLNIQVICTFNTDISKIDNALVRKGRLIAKYDFRELEMTKAQALSDKLSFSTIIDKSMTLAEVYNQGELNFGDTKKRNAIGFGANIN